MKKVCKHCGQKIHQINDKIWHDDSKILPQYCMAMFGSDLHEPEAETSDKQSDNR